MFTVENGLTNRAMSNRVKRWAAVLLICVAAPLCRAAVQQENTLYWNTNKNLVSADIRSGELLRVLSGIASATGWRVYVEPETLHNVSVKFKDLPPGEALHLLLGEVNFALVPQTNNTPKLFVFRTSMKRAIQVVEPERLAKAGPKEPKPIPNELIVRLKPGMKIEELAKLLGAKVTGRIGSLNAYRLEFQDQAATDAALAQLQNNPDVASVENNFEIQRPPDAQAIAGSAPPLSLKLNPPPDTGRVIVGLIDTAIQPLGNGLDQFLAKQVSLAGEAQLDPNAVSHGTMVVETLLRTLQTLGNGGTSVNIQPYDVYGTKDHADPFTVADAVDVAVNNGARLINMSLGGPSDSPMLRDLIQQANAKGIVFYGAVGNDAAPKMDYPAADGGVTPVTALDRNGQVTSYANNSDKSAIGALGTVVVPYNGQSWVATGTSVATPIVTGTAANLMEKGSMTAL